MLICFILYVYEMLIKFKNGLDIFLVKDYFVSNFFGRKILI